MDPALLRERQEFKRKALAQPHVENKGKVRSGPDAKMRKEAKKSEQLGAQSQSAKAKLDLAQMKSMSSGSGGSSQLKFSILAKIVRHMKSKYMEGEGHPLTLEEILDETNQLDVGNKIKAWLGAEALKNNPKVSFDESSLTYLYKPPYAISKRKDLLKLLKQHDLKGMGGIFLEDIQESLPNWEKNVRILSEENKIIVITRQIDKKKVVFYHDHTTDFDVDEDFKKLWRSVAVDSVDDAKIDEYLEKQGIRSMQDQGPRKIIPRKPNRKKPIRRKGKAPKDNEHMKDVLEDYNEMTSEKGNK